MVPVVLEHPKILGKVPLWLIAQCSVSFHSSGEVSTAFCIDKFEKRGFRKHYKCSMSAQGLIQISMG